MKCNNCGFEINEDFVYCPNCSAPSYSPSVMINPAAVKFQEVLKSNSILAMCILLTAASGFGIISGSFPLLTVLATIFLWIAYSKASKDELDTNQLRCISGTVYAAYVINYVAYIMVLISGIILIFAFGYLSSSPQLLDSFLNNIELNISGDILNIIESNITVFGFIISFILIVASVVSIIINATGMRKIHRFIKTVYEGIPTGQLENRYTLAAKNWLILLGVFSAISAFTGLISGNITSAISSACTAAVMILASSIINKNLL
ncbi:MAG: zinc ribbon domain-containing protein [Acutalibacteraceae bacterium]|nr:zinc ribbon domain-containing protein [Acutalibacteraceae bacterium]